MTENRAEQDVTDDSGLVEYDDRAFVQSVSSCTDGTVCYKILNYSCFRIIPIRLLTSEIIHGSHFTAAIMAFFFLRSLFTAHGSSTSIFHGDETY
jgi:hypothetical protein